MNNSTTLTSMLLGMGVLLNFGASLPSVTLVLVVGLLAGNGVYVVFASLIHGYGPTQVSANTIESCSLVYLQSQGPDASG